MASPLRIEDLRIRSISVDHNEVSWRVEATLLDVLDYTFQVFRSESPEGPWDEISEQFEDQFLFLDNAVMTQNRYRTWYYKIRLRHKASQEYWDTKAVSLGQEADIVAGELRVHINLLMHEFIGELCWILPVRTFGTRCPNCYSPTLRNKTKSGCRTCWDTSFIRGYMHPIESWMSIDPHAAVEGFTPLGKLQSAETTARTGYFPQLKPGDMIVESALVSRWTVVQVNAIKHVGTAVFQEIKLHQVPKASIEYNVPVEPVGGIRDAYLKPPRQFTNPHQLSALDDGAYVGILDLYTPHEGNS